MDDLIFLIERGFIRLPELERFAREAVSFSRQFDLSPDMLERLEDIKNQLERR